MSQYDFGDLESPLSGTTFFNTHLEPWRNALHSQHSGTTRPTYAVAGTLWIDSTTNPWVLNVFDGTNDIGVGLIDTVANTFTPVSVIAAADVEVDDAAFTILTAIDAQDAFEQIDALFAGLGTAASEDVGTAIGDVLQVANVGGNPGLPALDGSLLTGIQTALFLHLQHQLSSGTNGGTATAGSWETRALNTEVIDEIGSTLSSNTFTLPAGTYDFSAFMPSLITNRHQGRLYNVTDSSVTLLGTTVYSGTASAVGDYSPSLVRGKFTIAGTKTFRMEHRVTSTRASDGYGLAASFGTEVYSDVYIRKVA